MADGEAQSWGESIKKLEQSKKQLSWKPDEYIPVQKIGHFERRTMERELDPILMKYRDAEKELKYQQTTGILKKSSKNSDKYNIITHQGPIPAKKNINKKSRGARDWNLLSHLETSLHTTMPLDYDEELHMSLSRRPASTHGGKGTALRSKGRDFNVISNKYYVDHDERNAADIEKMRREMSERYWRTHDYDPLKQEYYDDAKELEYSRQLEAEKVMHALNADSHQPPSLRYSDGRTYNILTHDVTDEAKYKIASAHKDRSLHRVKGLEVMTRTTELALAQQERDEARKLAKISFKRWEEQIDRNYDPFLNSDMVLEPLPPRPASVWNRLHTDHASPIARPRDLSGKPPTAPATQPLKALSSEGAVNGTVSYIPNNTQANQISPMPSARSISSAQSDTRSARSAHSHHSQGRASTALGTRYIPSLDLNKTEQGPSVTYVEPKLGPPGMKIPMVRTGGGL